MCCRSYLKNIERLENMLLKEIYEKNHYSFRKSAKDWRDAIRLSCKPLEEDGTVDPQYAEEVIASVEKFGPYIIIMPDIAIPHAIHNAIGANNTAISFLKLEDPVSFEEGDSDKDVKVFFTLVATNPDEHLINMQKLSELLNNEEAVARLKEIKDAKELLEINKLLVFDH